MKKTQNSHPINSLPQLLTEEQLCEYLNKSIAWAQKARFEGKGPRFVKAGRTPLYPVEFVREWLMTSEAQEFSGLPEKEVAHG